MKIMKCIIYAFVFGGFAVSCSKNESTQPPIEPQGPILITKIVQTANFPNMGTVKDSASYTYNEKGFINRVTSANGAFQTIEYAGDLPVKFSVFSKDGVLSKSYQDFIRISSNKDTVVYDRSEKRPDGTTDTILFTFVFKNDVIHAAAYYLHYSGSPAITQAYKYEYDVLGNLKSYEFDNHGNKSYATVTSTDGQKNPFYKMSKTNYVITVIHNKTAMGINNVVKMRDENGNNCDYVRTYNRFGYPELVTNIVDGSTSKYEYNKK